MIPCKNCLVYPICKQNFDEIVTQYTGYIKDSYIPKYTMVSLADKCSLIIDCYRKYLTNDYNNDKNLFNEDLVKVSNILYKEFLKIGTTK